MAHLASLLEAGSDLGPGDTADPPREAIELVDRGPVDGGSTDLDGLSDEDVDARLRELLSQEAGDRR